MYGFHECRLQLTEGRSSILPLGRLLPTDLTGQVRQVASAGSGGSGGGAAGAKSAGLGVEPSGLRAEAAADGSQGWMDMDGWEMMG